MIADETVLTTSQAANLFREFIGTRPAPSTIWRWARRGLGGVCLEHGFVGRRMITSREACVRFVTRLAEARSGASPRLPVDRELDQHGIGREA